MRVNFNVSSVIAQNALANNDTRLSNSTLRLSSGLKINKASDNAAGLAIARKMDAQIKSLMRANQNSNDGLSVVNTADGAMAEMHDILQRMNELAIQSANGTNSDDDRKQIQLEIDELVAELDRIAETTEFNAQSLLDGTFAYKGYSNTENVKVMSYTDGVASGTYVVGQIEYYHYEDNTTTYTGEDKSIKNIESESSYEVSSADDVKNALIKSDQLANYNDISGIKAFPDDSLVTIEDDNIVIKAQGDFEVKLAINDRDAVTTSTYSSLASTAVATTTYSTYTYRNVSVAVSTATTVRYNINLINVGGEKGVNAVSEDDYRSIAQSLEEYFKDRNETNVEITNMTCDIDANGKASMKIDYKCTDAAGNEVNQNMELVLHQESKNINADPTISDGDKKEYTMNDYLYQMKETTKTTFVVGGNTKDDCVKFNITGMGAMQIQVGANEGQILAIEIPNLSTLYMGVDNLNISTEDKATAAIDTIGKAINYLSGVRAKIGAYANRLEHIITNLDTTEENMTAAYSRIMDVDMATEMTEYSTVQVLVQASTSMLAQANERPQQVLQLLQ
jgi:flagellin